MRVHRKAHMYSTLSLRSFPNIAFEIVPTFVWLTMALSRPLRGLSRPSSAFSFHASLLRAISCVMSLALCPHVVSQDPQHFRSSEAQATCNGRFRSSLTARSFVFSSVQFKMVSMCSEKPICVPPRLSDVSPMLPLNSSNVRLIDEVPFSSFEGSLNTSSFHASPPGDRWCDVLGFVKGGNVGFPLANILRSWDSATTFRGSLASFKGSSLVWNGRCAEVFCFVCDTICPFYNSVLGSVLSDNVTFSCTLSGMLAHYSSNRFIQRLYSDVYSRSSQSQYYSDGWQSCQLCRYVLLASNCQYQKEF